MDGRGKRRRIWVTLRIPLFFTVKYKQYLHYCQLELFGDRYFMRVCLCLYVKGNQRKSIKLSHMLLHSFVTVLRSMCNIHCHAFPTTNLPLTFDQHYMCDYSSIGIHTISFQCPISHLFLISVHYYIIHLLSTNLFYFRYVYAYFIH